jgi:NADP-reducing hydrogenase subunit HndB
LSNAKATLKEIKAKLEAARQGQSDVNARIIVGTATCGVSAGAKAVVEALKQEVDSRGLTGVAVCETGCSGRCDLEPLVQVTVTGEEPTLYYHIDPEKARRIVQQHIQNNEPVSEWVLS